MQTRAVGATSVERGEEAPSVAVGRPEVGSEARRGVHRGHEAMEITDRRVHGSDREVPREFDGEAAALRRMTRNQIDYCFIQTSQPLDHALFNYLSRRQALSRVR